LRESGGLDEIRAAVRADRTLDWLLETAKIRTEK
jgi:hypothetical protein